jgi:outer membrane cobalamin receptor
MNSRNKPSQIDSRLISLLLCFCGWVFFSTLPLFGQQSVIEGRVYDPSGALIRNAQVSCMDALGTTIQRVSDEQGRFRCPVTSSESYQVIAGAPGFASGIIPVPPLKPGETRTLDVKLQLSARHDTILVSASMMDQPLSQVGSSVNVITGEDLRNNNYALLLDALRDVPGLAVSSAGRRGGATSIFARGGNANYDLVLLDGVKMNDFGGGLGFDFAHMVADDVDRIEVVRGPQSALYGSEAIGATINVITPRGEGSPRFSFLGEGGSYVMRRWATGASGLSRGANWALNLSRLDTEGANFNDTYRDQNASGRLGWEGSAHTRAAVHFNFNANDAGAPGAYGRDPNQTFMGLDLTSRTKNNDYIAGGEVEHEFSPWFKQRIEGSVLSRNFRFLQSFGDSFSDNFRGTLRTESDLLLSPGATLAFGFEYQRERFFNNFITDPTGKVFALGRNNLGFFAEIHWSWKQRLFLTAGARLENFRTDEIPAVPYSHEQGFPASSLISASPRTTVAYFLNPAAPGRWLNYAKAHSSFGTGIRAPNGFELAFTSNPKLRPERTWSFDAGMESSWWKSRALMDVTYFYNHFGDQIITLTGDLRRLSTFTSDNLGNTRSQGVEWTLAVQPNSRVRLGGAYAFLSTEILSVTGSLSETQSVFKVGDPLIRRPRHSGSLFATWTQKRMILSMQTSLRGAVSDIDPNLGTYACNLGLPCIFQNPGFVNANLGASYEVRRGLTWYARVNNLLNRHYEDVLGYPAYRLNFVSGMRLDLGGERGFRVSK